jgi:hypothetical protein
MGKKLLKKAGVALLAVMMSLALMPMKEVNAATSGTPTLTLGASGLSGWVGDEISNASITATLLNDTIVNTSNEEDISDWMTNLPSGMKAQYVGFSGTTITINLSGKPTVESKESIKLTIPGNKLASGNALTAPEKFTAKYDIIKPAATIDNITISGAKDIAIAEVDVIIKPNVSLIAPVGVDVRSWFTNLPDGLTATVISNDPYNYQVVVHIGGTPTVNKDEALQIQIPKEYFGGGEDINVTANPNAKFEIGEREATVENVAITGSVGETITNQTFKITIKNDKFVKNLSATSNLKTNLPSDLFVVYSRLIDETHAVVSVTGTPLASEKGTLELTIPSAWLKSGKALKVTANPNATYDIGNVKITAGTNSSHKTGTTGDLKFTCSGKLDDFVGAYVDNALVNPSHYTVQSGSTILTLKANYLNTLASGTHTIKFQYKNNVSVTTTFKILADDSKKKPPVNQKDKTNNSKTPQTADMSPIAFYSLLVMVSGLAGVFVLKRKKEQI